MATVREGTASLLLIVDVQNAAVEKGYNSELVVENINIVVKKARMNNIPIVFVQHSDSDLVRGSARWQFVQNLDIRAGDMIIEKHYNSAFEDTMLERILGESGIANIVLAGAATNWCIRATAYGALDRGYDLTLIRDGHTTESIELADGRLLHASDLITDLNIAMTWLSYPGRKCRAVSAKEIVL